MATTTSYIDSSGSGANDYPSLSAWRAAITGGSYDQNQIVIVKEDTTDNLSLTGWSSAVNITIKSDIPGVKRTVFSKHNGNQMVYSGSANISALTIEDIIFDGAGDGLSGNTGQVATRAGITTTNGTDTLTLNRVHIKNVTQHAVLVWYDSDTATLNCDNCIFESPTGSAYRGARDTTTATFRNCLFVNCGSAAQNCRQGDPDAEDPWFVATNVGNYYNCLSFDNGGADFADANQVATTNVRYCVSKDSTAADANHDDNTGSVGGKTATGTYFTDYAGGDYTLAQDDFSSWAINGDSANTPARDFDYRSRVNDDIGPYDYVSLASVASLAPSLLKPGLTTPDRSNLKPSLTSSTYTGGTPGESSEVKPSLVDKEGNLKAGLTTPDGSELKPSLKK